jgi:hypothetical protein
VTFGPLFFAAPAALLALIALPALFWLLRATPPAPQRVRFPPLRILLGIRTEEEARRRAPLWLVLLRAFAAALAIIGFARPSLAPEAVASATGAGPTLIVIDDGWTSAPFWPAARAAAESAIADAERANQSVALLRTTPDRAPPGPADIGAPADARARLARIEPRAWRPDRAVALKRLQLTPGQFGRVLWIADGLGDDGSRAFAEALRTRGPTIVRTPPRTARALTDASADADGIVASVRRASASGAVGAIAAETAEGRSLGSAEFRFAGGDETTQARIALPPEIAARAARVRIVGETSAGAVRLMPAGSGRALVGLIDQGSSSQPLLSELHYVDRAIQPFATARRGGVRQLIDQNAQALILPDASRLATPERNALDAWLDKGGLLVRFAGPRLANDADEPLPVRLRPGSRTLGGALAWEKPQSLQPFSQESPFFGLTPPPDVAVRRQVLAEPASEREARVWARLTDGAPVVTAAPRGKGLVVLFHVTAGPEWSDLALSGLYVEMLKRTLAFAGRADSGARAGDASGPWLAERLLDGFGAFTAPDVDAQPIAPQAFAAASASPATPPGLYARTGGGSDAIDAARADETLTELELPAGVTRAGLDAARTRALGGPLLALALAVLALDLMIALALTGRLPQLRRASAAAAVAGALFMLTPDAHAQQQQQRVNAASDMHLAYIVTGDARADRVAKAGLDSLAEELRARTAVEPGVTIGVNPATDDLSAFPVLYWLAPSTPTRLSDTAVANLDRYMRLGGLLFVDTRDAESARARAASGAPGPAAIMLQGLDAPPLELIGGDHVLTRAFYLLRSFPGRHQNARVYAETAAAAAARDGVAALMVGDGDWATAWMSDNTGRAVGGVADRQHELALRFGINLVMVALTGNYKADQVHVPALLERMGDSTDRRR